MKNAYMMAREIARALLGAETPPFTVELIRQKVLEASSIPTTRLEPAEADQLVKELETSFNVWIGVQNALDNDDDHVAWLAGRRAQIQWRYWERFERLLRKQGWPEATVSRLGEMTDAVLERLEDPRREGTWDRRGLVAGHVQSGKTANYTGLVCKAADAGYKLIIVLAGIHSSLRSQTQVRLDEGFLGYDSRQNQGRFGGPRIPIGVGLIDPGCPPVDSVTTSLENGDFNRAVAGQFNINPGGNPLLFVIKKNPSVLRNILGWVSWAAHQRDEDGRHVVTNLPLLMIDDEADYASVDTNAMQIDENGDPDPDHDPTPINGLIRSLLHTFRQSAYVGYTATPFANIFIHEKAETRDEGPDLFPRSFIINLPAPSNYVGPVRVFGLDPDPDAGLEGSPGLPIVRTNVVMNDYADWIPDKHNKDYVPGPLPPSLREAIRSFVLACTARIARGHTAAHNSMLVHVTRLTFVQEKVTALVREELKSIEQRLKWGDGKAPSQITDELKKLWEDDFRPTTEKIADPDLPPMEWTKIEPHLYDAVSRIKVRTINGTAGDVLDYVDSKSEGLSVIAIGGDKLSRGLTLEGLSVSYYLRASKMYDTLMQMGRWFGYRPSYSDLCRLYTTDELVDWYKHITAANEELRRLFDHMAEIGSTPKDFGFRVKTHPDGLMITGPLKMRHSTEVQLSFSQSVSETVVFEKTKDVVGTNYEKAERFIRSLGPPDDVVPQSRKIMWLEVPAQAVLNGFLANISTPERETAKVRPELLRAYIEKLVAVGELTKWTVVLIGTTTGTPHTLAGHDIGLVERDHNPDVSRQDDWYRIRRLVSPQDEGLDLSDEQLADALEKTRLAWRADPGRSRRTTAPDLPSGLMMRAVRSSERGLLLIYPLDTVKTETDKPLIGFAFSFPRTDRAATVSYRVTNLYWQQEYGG